MQSSHALLRGHPHEWKVMTVAFRANTAVDGVVRRTFQIWRGALERIPVSALVQPRRRAKTLLIQQLMKQGQGDSVELQDRDHVVRAWAPAGGRGPGNGVYAAAGGQPVGGGGERPSVLTPDDAGACVQVPGEGRV